MLPSVSGTASIGIAATLLQRTMIEDTLGGAKSKRYRYAARHLAECRSVATLIDDYGQFETHEHFVARLQVNHGREVSFWRSVAANAALRSD